VNPDTTATLTEDGNYNVVFIKKIEFNVQQPRGSRRIGHVFHAVREGDAAHQRVPVPVLAAGELAHDVGIEGFALGHGEASCLFFGLQLLLQPD
jgi:hypothetical protein